VRLLTVLTLVVAVTGPAMLAPCPALGAAPSGKPTISPAPGTQDASPQTQISVLGVAPRAIASVQLTGATSGAHDGRLRAYSGRRGASFVPARPLEEGEQATAIVHIRGRAPVRLSFTIARLGAVQSPLPLIARQQSKLDHFVTEPDLLPPSIDVFKRSFGLRGDIFMTPLPSPIVHPGSVTTVTISPVGPGGPMIVDGRGKLLWFRQLASPNVAANLQVENYRGRPVLTWWQGGVTPSAFGIGEGVIADTSYRTIATVHAGNGYAMDLHEFRLLPNGDALFTVYSPVLVHLRGTAPGTMSRLLDAIVQEVDIRTGLVVWEWHRFGHIPLKDSYATPANSASYDAFHVNALQFLAGDQALVSARDTSAIYDIDRASGRIVWTLGGKASSFRLGPGARFFLQHDAEMLPGGRISLFDDEAGPPVEAPSGRGLILALHRRRHLATVVRQYRRPADTSPESEGSLQILSGGDAFVGFGSQPFFSEFSAGGRLLFDASLPQGDGSYRVLRFDWGATPRTRPAVLARRTAASHISVYVSWNGATAVVGWQVLAGRGASALTPVATARKRDFETRVDLVSSAGTVAVRALGADGRVLATSSPTAVS
jgi:hypothetical protein